jgi:Tat protein translocase TatB subunit
MFGVGWGEVLVIMILVFLLYGPEQIPDKARKAGRLIKRFRGFSEEVKRSIEREIEREPPEPEKKGPDEPVG